MIRAVDFQQCDLTMPRMLNGCKQPTDGRSSALYEAVGKSTFQFNYLPLCTPRSSAPFTRPLRHFFTLLLLHPSYFLLHPIPFPSSSSFLPITSLNYPPSPLLPAVLLSPLSPPLICSPGSGPVKLPVLQSDGDRVQNLITHWLTARTTRKIFSFSPSLFPSVFCFLFISSAFFPFLLSPWLSLCLSPPLLMAGWGPALRAVPMCWLLGAAGVLGWATWLQVEWEDGRVIV